MGVEKEEKAKKKETDRYIHLFSFFDRWKKNKNLPSSSSFFTTLFLLFLLVFSCSQMEALLSETQQLFQAKESEETWESFNTQLRKWEQLLLTTTTPSTKTKLVSSLGYFGGIASFLQASLASERTILSATACDVVKAAASSLGPDFESLQEVFCPALVKLCQRTNKVFIKRAEETMFSLIEAPTRSTKMIPMLCENLSKSNKNKQSKLSAAKFMLKVFQAPENQVALESHTDSITVALAEVWFALVIFPNRRFCFLFFVFCFLF